MKRFLTYRNLIAAVLSALPSSAVQADAVASSTEQKHIEAACVGHSGFDIVGGHIAIVFNPGDYRVGAPALCDWIARAALAVSDYYGRFPVPEVRLVLKPVDGTGAHGSTYGNSDDGKPLIAIRLGRDTSVAQLADDWVLTHEMVHLSVPSVPRRSHWLEEGIATYVEPIARLQRGELSQARVWADMLHGMRKGLPAQGDHGLEITHTWGRTYWGGALFCLMADVQIHARTDNRKGLQDALRGVLAAGGSIRVDWPVARVLATGDEATGTTVLSELYGKLSDSAAPSDAELDALWQTLGVQADGDSVRFDDRAPLAASRRAITAGARAD
ncbi:MAG TPA: hypothetical protein VH183_00810 [Burkholderiaceae bacterium]|jgi:hypothetical protein|nr:hypothetical protein [Burkholderiaceae bacterium]